MTRRSVGPLKVAAVVALALGGCATPLRTPRATLERREVDGELVYQAAVAALDSALAAGRLSQERHDAAWRRAWADLGAVRRLYANGQDIVAALAALRADLDTAKGASR